MADYNPVCTRIHTISFPSDNDNSKDQLKLPTNSRYPTIAAIFSLMGCTFSLDVATSHHWMWLHSCRMEYLAFGFSFMSNILGLCDVRRMFHVLYPALLQ
ncbi:hypothetical protein CEXT_242771 [Caerostris extrusa]|uniref:Uncharacterized protein n=1 Tax=Caerostris extrusa TaxID=172846 RepID=A0AAV4NSV2_CAEEX|nr:hypothetical protein CEXT_242771 [Caerostris extrusa]